jgi:SOS-response transcriptional repressor LexA
MAIGGRRGHIRDIQSLAKRVFDRYLAYRRRHRGQSVPLSGTLSRILEHDPAYLPPRQRTVNKSHPPLQNPGIFTVQRDVAEALETTVGDLLGEPGYEAARELVSTDDRRKLRQAVQLLRDLFDLDDESLDVPQATDSTYRFVVGPDEFIERDHDYPRTLHAWVVPTVADYGAGPPMEPDFSLTTTQVLHSVREIWDARLQVIRIHGDSMAPELQDGWKVLVDTEATKAVEGALVAVYLKYEGGVLGRWNSTGDETFLRKTNPTYPPVPLPHPSEYKLWGTVTRIVEAPVELRGR